MMKTCLLFSNKGLKIFHQNIHGLINKLDNIKILLGESRQIHVLGMTETKLDNSILDAEIAIDGYTAIRRVRTSGSGGGVCMFIRDDLNWDRRYDYFD